MRVKLRRGLFLAGVLATGEAHAVEGGAVDRSTSHAIAIARGSPSAGAVSCSGTLVSANVVLTVRHCIATVTTAERPCATTLGTVAADVAKLLWVNASPWTGEGASWTRVAKVRLPEQTSVCGDDIALLTLQEPVPEHDAVPARPVVDEATFLRFALERSIGLAAFGATGPDATDIGTRRSRRDIPIDCVPGQPAFRCGAELDFIDFDREFTTGRGPCRGDSGGGATPASDPSLVLGVLSRGDRGSDGASCALGVFERTDRWAWLIARTVIESATEETPAPEWARALFPSAAKAGAFCTNDGSCEPGSACMSLDEKRSWQCAQTCEADAGCDADHRCTNGYCVTAPREEPVQTSGCTTGRIAGSSWALWPLLGGAVLGLKRRRRGQFA